MRVTFRCGDLDLEGVLEGMPRQPGHKRPAVVVCHPHPVYGGDMHNNVVLAVCDALSEAGIAALRFNFRGVGASKGQFGDGIGEQDDVRAAVDYLAPLPAVAPGRIGLAGYSFGALVALQAAKNDHRVHALAAVSPPLAMSDLSFMALDQRPKLFVAGSRDDFVPLERFSKLVTSLKEPKEQFVVVGADHFWSGHEATAAQAVVSFFRHAFQME